MRHASVIPYAILHKELKGVVGEESVQQYSLLEHVPNFAHPQSFQHLISDLPDAINLSTWLLLDKIDDCLPVRDQAEFAIRFVHIRAHLSQALIGTNTNATRELGRTIRDGRNRVRRGGAEAGQTDSKILR